MNRVIVSLLSEKWPGDRRVLMFPKDVKHLTENGIEVFVERGAGSELGLTDDEYQSAGAISAEASDCYKHADIIAKYKAPHPSEYGDLRSKHKLACFVYLEHDRSMVEAFCDKKLDVFGLTYFKTPDGYFPLPGSDNELTGKMAVLYGAYHLQTHLGGMGLYLGHMPGVTKPKVLVIGYGRAGAAAARTALALGNDVTVLGTSNERLRIFEGSTDFPIRTRVNNPETLAEELSHACLVIGAIRDSTVDTPAMIDRKMLGCMRKGSVLVDVTCGYGAGYLPTFSDFTYHEDPYYVVDGIVHIKIDRLPMTVPITGSQAVGGTASQYLTKMALALQAGESDPTSDAGLLMRNGKVVHAEVASNLKLLWPSFSQIEIETV